MTSPSAAQRAELASLTRRFRIKPVAYHFVEVKRQRLSEEHTGHGSAATGAGMHKANGVCTGCGSFF